MHIEKGILHSPVHDQWITAWESMFICAGSTINFTNWNMDHDPGVWTNDCIVIIPGELL